MYDIYIYEEYTLKCIIYIRRIYVKIYTKIYYIYIYMYDMYVRRVKRTGSKKERVGVNGLAEFLVSRGDIGVKTNSTRFDWTGQ